MPDQAWPLDHVRGGYTPDSENVSVYYQVVNGILTVEWANRDEGTHDQKYYRLVEVHQVWEDK